MQANFREVETPKGLVRIVGLQETVTDGWRDLGLDEARELEKYLRSMMSTWSIVACGHGKFDGPGYGWGFHESYGPECGEKFIITNNW